MFLISANAQLSLYETTFQSSEDRPLLGAALLKMHRGEKGNWCSSNICSIKMTSNYNLLKLSPPSGRCRTRVVHSHHLHRAFPGQRQPWHREEEPGVPCDEPALRPASKGSRARQEVGQRRAGRYRGHRREQQPRHQHPAHRPGPRRPEEDEPGEGGLHQRDPPP